MIIVEDLTFEIKGKKLINCISAHFEKGKMHLILGPNGAGKSTFIKLISGELKPSKGAILMDGVNLHKIPIKELAKNRSVLSQNIELSFPLNVNEVVRMGRYPHVDGNTDSLDKICDAAMKFFNVNKMKNRNYMTLSGGEKQRVQFARVFAQIWEPIEGKKRLLLLDEPLTFLDIFYQYDLMKKIKQFMLANTDLTVIGVVHDINIAAKFSDKVMCINDGAIYTYGNAKEVLTEKTIWNVFNVKVENYFNVK